MAKMLEKTISRIMNGARTPEGKVIAILLVVCLSLMTWNVGALSYAVNGEAAKAAEEKAAQVSEEKKQQALISAQENPPVESAKQTKDEAEQDQRLAEEKEEKAQKKKEAEKKRKAQEKAAESEATPSEPEVAESAEDNLLNQNAEQAAPASEESSNEQAAQGDAAEDNEAGSADQSSQAEVVQQADDSGQRDSAEGGPEGEAEAETEQTPSQQEETDENPSESESPLIVTTGEDDGSDEGEPMPACKFSARANGVAVKVSAPAGAFPKGTTMMVDSVAAAQVVDVVEDVIDGSAVAIKAISIGFIDAEGKRVDPKADVNVTLKAADIAAAAGNDERSTALVGVSADGGASLVDYGTKEKSPNAVFFEGRPASSYAIVVFERDKAEEPSEIEGDGDQEAANHLTYQYFLTDAQGNTFEYRVDGKSAKQTVKEGDVLVEPQTPSLGDYEEFSGWYVRGTSDAVQFGKVETIERNATIDVVGEINTVFYATLMNGRAGADAEWPVLTNVKATAEKGAAEAVAAVGVHSATSVNDDERFLGWTEDPAATDVQFPAGENLTLSDDTTLYPVFGKAYWLYFDENDGGAGGGARYTAPEYVGFDESPTRPADPQRAGYNFTGWYADAACTQTFDFTRAYNTKTTAYAGWKKASAAYTVIFWQQRVSDDKDAADADKTYDYKESAQRSSYTDEVVVPTDADLAKKYQGFHLNSAKTDSQATVAADGSTVLNVYYDRDLITMTFKGIGETGYTYTSTTSTSGTQYGYVNGEYVELSRTSQ
ncbi:MAG: InlB B-repeat-containing protein, partial [Kiritimatiellae bacterium]|nr:InlB B-repeat-containing protein [Kiritimatiellia bacterium]